MSDTLHAGDCSHEDTLHRVATRTWLHGEEIGLMQPNGSVRWCSRCGCLMVDSCNIGKSGAYVVGDDVPKDHAVLIGYLTAEHMRGATDA